MSPTDIAIVVALVVIAIGLKAAFVGFFLRKMREDAERRRRMEGDAQGG